MTFFTNLTFFGAVLVPFFTEWGRITIFQMFILQSWAALWVMLLEVPTGVIADKFGRKYSLVLGGIIVIMAALLYGSVPRFEVFLLAEFLFALAIALQSGADEALLYDTLKENDQEHEASKIIGRTESIRFLGLLSAAPIGSFIAAKYGLNYPLLFTATPFLIGTILAWSIKEPSIHRGSEKRRYLDIAKKGLSFFYNHKVLRLVAADAVIVSVAAYYVVWFYQPILQELNVPIFWFGYFYVLMAVTEILVSSNYAFLEKVFGSKKTYLRFSAIVSALAFIIVAIIPNVITVALLLVFAGGIGYTRLKFMSAYMNSLIPSTERATVLSSVSLLRRSAILIVNPIVGFMADKSLSLTLLFIGLLPLAVFFFSPIEQEMFE